MRQEPSSEQEKGNKIVIEHFETLTFDQKKNPDVRLLEGNVIFRHDSTYMYCDSAYVYNSTNSLEAFGKVFIEQGDTLFIYGDYLKYDGNSSLAMLRENVRMENRNTTLYTDNFNYDRAANMAYYFDGGMLTDSLNELSSVYGQYSPATKVATFQNIVELVNPNFVLTTDTLLYNTNTKIAFIDSPSVIDSDSGVIYSSRGWYDSSLHESMLLNRSTILSKDKTKTLTADTIFYNRNTGIGEAFSDMVLNDTVRKMIMTGDYGLYNELTNFAFATDSARFIDYSQQDSLFLHADTLQMKTIGEERELKAYYGVRFYRSDMQGVCDSIQYNTVNSLLTLYRNPVLWNDLYQMTADTIKVQFNSNNIDRFYAQGYAFAVEEVDHLYHNQLKGRSMTMHFEEGNPYRLNVDGNAESIYYPIEEGKGYTGQNATETSFMTIDIRDRKPIRIKWHPSTQAKLIPIPDITPENKYLKGFVNYDYIRPLNPDDIFRPTVRKAEDVPAPRRKRSND